MKIQYCSDLHVDFAGVTLPGGEVLVIAGDVAESRKVVRHKQAWELLTAEEQADPKYIELYRCWTFWLQQAAKYERVFYVLGNHEHYGGRFDLTHDELRAVLPANVTLMENSVVEYGDVVFLGATLWTNANNHDQLTLYTLKYGMNDYKVIKTHNKSADIYHKLTPETTVATHVKTVNYLGETLSQYADRKVVVITHHAPSFMSISEQYRGPGDHHMNGGYASDLSEFILDHPQIKVMVHGHVHSHHDYMIGTTRILARPRGYKGHEQIAEDFEVGSFEIDDQGNFIF
jgi:Icc-related predicted phosphoesterase